VFDRQFGYWPVPACCTGTYAANMTFTDLTPERCSPDAFDSVSLPSTASDSQLPFEGVEKRLIVQFSTKTLSRSRLSSLQDIGDSVWQELLDYARCYIISKCSSHGVLAEKCSVCQKTKEPVGIERSVYRGDEGCTAYLLSESSLFVFKNRVIIKTCGTTTPLLVLDPLLQLVHSGGLSCVSDHLPVKQASLESALDLLVFTHIDYRFPERQKFPHRNFEEEVDYIRCRLPSAEDFQVRHSNQEGGFHLVIWGSEGIVDKGTIDLCIFEMMMIRIDEQSTERFAGEKPFQAKGLEEMTACSGTEDIDGTSPIDIMTNENSAVGVSGQSAAAVLKGLLPADGAQVDQFWFSPCGYSCNALVDTNFLSVHISPEPEASYASVESTIPFDQILEPFFCESVVEAFRPSELQMLQIAIQTKGESPLPSAVTCEQNTMVLQRVDEITGNFYRVLHGFYSLL